MYDCMHNIYTLYIYSPFKFCVNSCILSHYTYTYRLSITINRPEGTALFDFTGTGCEVYGNLNAPPAVTSSAVIYCLRCLLPESDIPLNQG